MKIFLNIFACLLFAHSASELYAEESFPAQGGGLNSVTMKETYGCFGVKWYKEATNPTKLQTALNQLGATAKKATLTAISKFAAKPGVKSLAAFLSTVVRPSPTGQNSSLFFTSTIGLAGVSASGMTGTVSIGDPQSGGISYPYTFTHSAPGTIDGVAVTAFYSDPPTTTTPLPYVFCALIEPTGLTGYTAGEFVCYIVDPNLIAPLAQAGVTNVTTPQGGTPVSVQIGLSIIAQNGASIAGTSSFADTYFSVENLAGVGVPPEFVAAAQKAFQTLKAKASASVTTHLDSF